ncbi:MAG: 1-acyl-sn-glycerol-3-phosphate acyltransferase [Ignavibacteria bacterium]|nr:MAG: 1-acyl-sn-glycerol-3-phosphate acyltransferase [Ignavibacteria bacterium]KAF0161132.1 MAG: 1-acyl-sn-glycerol-3-phosphate acyltransferase [Ignavibacteria bacterium]
MKENVPNFNIYSAQNEYKTNEVNFRPKLFPTLYFFSHLFRIISYSNRQAKLGTYNGERWTFSSADVVRSIEKAGVRLHFEGVDILRNLNGPVVFIGNHMSTLETMVLPCLIHPYRKVVYVIKQELAEYPLFGPVALARDPILVGRENPREDLRIVMEEGSEKLSNGKSVIIFPQKTRSQIIDSSSFNSLGVKLAKRSSVPVVPIALLTDAWGKGKLIKDFGKIDTKKTVRICFGSPIDVKGNGAAEHQQVIDFISNKLIEWGRSDLVVK